MSWKGITVPRKYFELQDSPQLEDMINAGFGILAGRSDDDTLSRMIVTAPDGREFLVNDDCCWLYTDVQCHYHSLFGWRPFCSAEMRKLDFTTWSLGFIDQVSEQLQQYFRDTFGMQEPPPVGWLPAQFNPDEKHFIHKSPGQFYCNVLPDTQEWAFEEDKLNPGYHCFSRMGKHDFNPDYPLMNCISVTDWILWERDEGVARQYLPRVEHFLTVLNTKRDKSGFFLFGPQGSQMEYAHGGNRHQTSTHLYYWKVVSNLSHVYGMLGQHEDSHRYQQIAEDAHEKVSRFWVTDGWFISGFNEGFSRVYGNGRIDGSLSDYLEVWPNVNAAVLGYLDRDQCRAMADRFESIPPLVENHLTITNYPARPVEELDDDHDSFPPPGRHINGGWWWMHSGLALGMYTRGENAQTLLRLEELLEDHLNRLSIDGYYNWGINKESQYKDLAGNEGTEFPTHTETAHSVGTDGAFGHFYRSLFDLRPTANSLMVTPACLSRIKNLKVTEPVRWGGKELYLELRGEGKLTKATLDDKEIEIVDSQTVEILFDSLNEKSSLKMELR